MQDYGMCSVCLENYAEDNPETKVIRLCCSHIFHSECIRQVATKNKAECPLCRRSFSLKNLKVSKINLKKIIEFVEFLLETFYHEIPLYMIEKLGPLGAGICMAIPWGIIFVAILANEFSIFRLIVVAISISQLTIIYLGLCEESAFRKEFGQLRKKFEPQVPVEMPVKQLKG